MKKVKYLIFQIWVQQTGSILQKILLYGSDTIIKPVKSDYFKDEVKRPKFTITDKSRITKSFNIKINDWEKIISQLYQKNDFE